MATTIPRVRACALSSFHHWPCTRVDQGWQTDVSHSKRSWWPTAGLDSRHQRSEEAGSMGSHLLQNSHRERDRSQQPHYSEGSSTGSEGGEFAKRSQCFMPTCVTAEFWIITSHDSVRSSLAQISLSERLTWLKKNVSVSQSRYLGRISYHCLFSWKICNKLHENLLEFP